MKKREFFKKTSTILAASPFAAALLSSDHVKANSSATDKKNKLSADENPHEELSKKEIAESNFTDDKSYDYIIIGGGTSGPVIATRLSENPNLNILLIEAGGENVKEAIGYVNGAGMMWTPDTNWGYNSTPQKGLKERAIMQPRGKVMGGSASINIGSWSRGIGDNYNSWGLKDWTWDKILPWYKKIENSDKGSEEYRGMNGPMLLETSPEGTPITQTFKKACEEIGLGSTEDLNGKNNEGFDVWQCIYRNGRRHNTINNYLDGARLRSNLTIMTNTFVNKVNIENSTAVSVICAQEGKSRTIVANKEIIICTGTYATPKLLMLSGIGPSEHLKSLGINVVKDLPGVGKNLSDHLRTDIGVMSPDGVGESLRANPQDPKQLEEWRSTGYGPLSVAENTSVTFFKSSNAAPVADMEFMFNINAPMQWGAPPPKNNGYHIDVGFVQPKSKGDIMLASADPKEAMLINPAYLSHPEDIKTYTKGIKRALTLMQSETMKPLTDMNTISLQPQASDQEIEEYIRSKAESIYHPVGTAKMGNDDDPMAVVNSKLQVRGIKNLRVADASVIPELISGHTMAPTVLVAERTAYFIQNS